MPSPAASDRPRMHGLRAPRPILSSEDEERLTGRQKEILGRLEELSVAGELFALTLADLAERLNCSLRTLYGLAPSKDELVLMIIDRRLHRIGRRAMASIEPGMSALQALRAYLHAANNAVGQTSELFSRALVALPGAGRLCSSHENYVVTVTERLLEQAVAEGAVGAVDTAACALVLGGLGRLFVQPEVMPLLRTEPKVTADAVADLLFAGLETTRD